MSGFAPKGFVCWIKNDMDARKSHFSDYDHSDTFTILPRFAVGDKCVNADDAMDRFTGRCRSRACAW